MTTKGLSVENVRFDYEDMRMLFDLSVPRGEFLAIVGPSGAGKSTLLDLIAGFADPLEGRIAWDGQNLGGRPPSERPLSILFQEHNLFNHLDVRTNVALGVSPKLVLSGAEQDSVTRSIERVGLSGFERRLPGELSGGERQRVGLARMLVRDRPLLLLDEPFGALGPQLKRDMLGLLADLHRERGFTVLLVTHDPADAKAAATHVALVHDGRILLKKQTREFFATTDSPELAAYLGR